MGDTTETITDFSTTPILQFFNGTTTANSTEPELSKFWKSESGGDIGYMLVCTALVFLMIPGVGYFYNGIATSKSSLSLIMLSCWSVAIVSIQWFLFGYSLTFSRTASPIIGDFNHVVLHDIYDKESIGNDKIPEIVFCIYQGMFAAITPALAIGAGAERGRFLPTLVFIFIWTTLVYDFLAEWTWNPNGWGFTMGGLDFAGGTPVHISSGAAALAYAVVLGHREDKPTEEKPPHNMSNVVLGTALLWFGWFGFNGGSALAPTPQAAMACFVTNLAACVGGITWVMMDYRHEKKFSALGFCVGAVAGLVCVTPASGYIGPASSLAFGFFGAVCCNLAMNLKHWLHYDDALDVFAVHGVGGIVGNILTGVFARKYYGAAHGGWLDENWIQVAHQLADTAAGFIWSFTVTYIILFVMNKIPGLSLRVDSETERQGLDFAELGVNCYEHVEEVKTQSQVSFGNFGTTQMSQGFDNNGMKNGSDNIQMQSRL